MKQLIRKFWCDDDGQDIAEYAIMLAVIAAVVVTAVTAIGNNANSVFTNIATLLG